MLPNLSCSFNKDLQDNPSDRSVNWLLPPMLRFVFTFSRMYFVFFILFGFHIPLRQITHYDQFSSFLSLKQPATSHISVFSHFSDAFTGESIQMASARFSLLDPQSRVQREWPDGGWTGGLFLWERGCRNCDSSKAILHGQSELSKFKIGSHLSEPEER